MKRMPVRLGFAALAAAGGLAGALTLGAPSANADIIFTLGNHPQPDENNILFSSAETGATIFGAVNGVAVKFNTLTGQTLFQHAQGQADILNFAGTPLTSMEVSVPGYNFKDFILNLQNGTGTAHVVVTDNSGQSFDYALGNGENYLTLTAEDGESISDIQIWGAGSVNGESSDIQITGTGSVIFGFDEFKQPRISGVCKIEGGDCVLVPPTAVVPEPASLILLGSALVGFGLIRRRLGGRRARRT